MTSKNAAKAYRHQQRAAEAYRDQQAQKLIDLFAAEQRDGLQGPLTKVALQGPLTKAGPSGPMTKGERPRTWPSPQQLERIRRLNSGKATFYAREVITMLEADAWPNQSRAFADAMDKLVGLWRQARSKPRRK